MKILALDLGTHCGFAHTCSDYLVSGTWHTANKEELKRWKKERMDRRCDQRIIRFSSSLRLLSATFGRPDIVIFEDVEFMKGRLQVQLWSSFRAIVWDVFGGHPGINIECVPVQTLKVFSGAGAGATKERMEKFLRMRAPSVCKPIMDDNEVDALWLYLWAQKNLGRMTNVKTI